jgi:hypothetical protein
MHPPSLSQQQQQQQQQLRLLLRLFRIVLLGCSCCQLLSVGHLLRPNWRFMSSLSLQEAQQQRHHAQPKLGLQELPWFW